MTERLVVKSKEVRISPGIADLAEAFNTPVLTIDSDAVASGVDLRVDSLSIPVSGADTDLLVEARRVRATAPVKDGVLDASFDIEPLQIAKFDARDVLPVGLGGTGIRELGDKLLIVGKDRDGLETVPAVSMDDGVLSITGTLALTLGSDVVRLSSTLDREGRPAMQLHKHDGQKLDIMRVRSSLYPVITQLSALRDPSQDQAAPADHLAYKVTASFDSYLPSTIVVSAYRGSPLGRKTSQEILESYGTLLRAAASLSGSVQQGYPSRVQYISDVVAFLPSDFSGALCCVVKDSWGSVSDPAEILLA